MKSSASEPGLKHRKRKLGFGDPYGRPGDLCRILEDARIIRESWHICNIQSQGSIMYHECSEKLSGNLVVKLKAFVQLFSTTCISLAFGLFSDEFQTIQAEICLNYDYLPRVLTTTIASPCKRGKSKGKASHIWRTSLVQSENRCAQGFNSDPLSKGNSDQWSDDRVVTRYIFSSLIPYFYANF